MIAEPTLTEKRWAVKEKGDANLIQELSRTLNIGETLANILVQRGITTYDEAKKYFRPDIKDLHDPFLMKDMDKAITRIEKAIAAGEKILVYGDYDEIGRAHV